MMKSRLEQLPRYQTDETQIEPALFNQVRLALIRLDDEIRFAVEGLQNLEVILHKDYWVCVDASLNDVPIFAWMHFQAEHRDNLHQPIQCKLYSYHAHAALIIEPVSTAISTEIDRRLHDTGKLNE